MSKYYAVARGREVGVFKTWTGKQKSFSTNLYFETECEKQVKGFNGARYKKFKTRNDAENFVMNNVSRSNHRTSNRGGKKMFYAVAKGRNPGIYRTWEECKKRVKDFFGAKYRKFGTYQEAEDFINSFSSNAVISPYIPTIKPPTKESEDNYLSNIMTSQQRDINHFRNYNIRDPPVTGNKRRRDDVSNIGIQPSFPSNKRSKIGRNLVTIYTDGSCTNNHNRRKARAGVGVFFGHGDPRNISRRLEGEQTNNRAELAAISDAIKAVEDKSSDIEIRSDSEYSIKVIQGVWNAKKNIDLVESAKKLIKDRKGKVIFKKVPAHSGVDGNCMADRLANEGAAKEIL